MHGHRGSFGGLFRGYAPGKCGGHLCSLRVQLGWVLDILGFLAGLFFAVQCWLSSNRTSADFRSGNVWIAVWAFATLGARIIDTLMLFGVVKWNAVYVTPSGAVLWSNVVSEVAFGNAFAVTALVGAMILLLYPQNVDRPD